MLLFFFIFVGAVSSQGAFPDSKVALVADAKDCTPGQFFKKQEKEGRYYSCKKFGKRLIDPVAGCLISGYAVPIGSTFDSDAAKNNSIFGFRYLCIENGGVAIAGCKIEGNFFAVNATYDKYYSDDDYSIQYLCFRTDINTSLRSVGCILAPGTSDEVKFKVGEIKQIPELDLYYKCVDGGFYYAPNKSFFDKGQ